MLEAQVVQEDEIVDDDNNNDEDDEDDDEEEELELLQVDLGDVIKMKQVLDEAVSAALLENPADNVYDIGIHLVEDTAWDNMKLCIMAAACLFAMVAQFAPLPFPESRPVLGVCGTLYFVLSGVLQYITTFIDQDAILMTLPVQKDKDETKEEVKDAKSSSSKKSGSNKPADNKQATTPKNPLLSQYGLRVPSNLPRFSEFYTVILEFQPNSNKKGGEKVVKMPTGEENPTVRETWSVGKFFDKEGYFDEVGCMLAVTKLYERMERQDYDDEATKKKKLE